MFMLSESTTVRALLTAYPQVFPVLLNHGMCADCRTDPPEVPLARFAEKHCGGDLAGLIDELRGAMDSPAAGRG